jgi:hypothetical protein
VSLRSRSESLSREVRRAVPSILASLSVAALFGLRVVQHCYDIKSLLASFIENSSVIHCFYLPCVCKLSKETQE